MSQSRLASMHAMPLRVYLIAQKLCDSWAAHRYFESLHPSSSLPPGSETHKRNASLAMRNRRDRRGVFINRASTFSIFITRANQTRELSRVLPQHRRRFPRPVDGNVRESESAQQLRRIPRLCAEAARCSSARTLRVRRPLSRDDWHDIGVLLMLRMRQMENKSQRAFMICAKRGER